MKKLIVFILLFMPLLIFGQGVELGTGKPWDVISAAAGAAAGMIIYAAKDLLVSLFQLWTAKIREKMPTRENK